MKHTFNYNMATLQQLPNKYNTEQIKHETMIFSGDVDFCLDNGGPITRELVESLSWTKYTGLNTVIDTRVTMCMEGYYPSIPGWHCDDVPRPNGQPDLSLIDSKVKHIMCLFSDTESHSCTEFVIDKPTFIFDDKTEIWTQLDHKVNLLAPKTRFIKAGEVLLFDQNSIHRASPAKSNGWRYFFRMSFTHRKPKNEIRNQVQVYVPYGKGW